MWSVKVLWLHIIAYLCQRIESAVFDGCDHVYDLNPGLSYLESPDYEERYEPYTSCRYKFKAPDNYGITVRCNIDLDKDPNSCSTEFFYLARDGDTRLRGSEQLCGKGSFTRMSLFNIFTIAYISGGASGIFNCSLHVQRRPCDCGWSVNTKIVNGEDAYPNEFPSLVALRDRSSNMPLYCSGAIISPIFVATAAHCANFQPNAALIDVLAGRQNIESTTDTQYSDVYRVSEILKHPDYSPDPTKNDLSLMKLSRSIELKRGVGPICLPPITNINNDFSYSEVDVAGWGANMFAGSTSPTLKKVKLMVADQETCQDAYKDSDEISYSHMCTYDFTGQGKDSCQYDSGGPVMLKHLGRYILIGVISFGKHCGAGLYAIGVNERVTSHLEWILQNTEGTTCYVEM